MTGNEIGLSGAELNRRLDALALKIERMSVLLEEAMVDPGATIPLGRSEYNDLAICLSRYDEFLTSMAEATQDAIDQLREICGTTEICCDERDADEELEAPEEEDKLQL